MTASARVPTESYQVSPIAFLSPANSATTTTLASGGNQADQPDRRVLVVRVADSPHQVAPALAYPFQFAGLAVGCRWLAQRGQYRQLGGDQAAPKRRERVAGSIRLGQAGEPPAELVGVVDAHTPL